MQRLVAQPCEQQAEAAKRLDDAYRAAHPEIPWRALAGLRDLLLPKLIRGEMRVKDAERFLEERGL